MTLPFDGHTTFLADNQDGAFNLPPASLIICTRNRPLLLAETVASILQGDELPAELVIVDQSDAPNPIIGGIDSARPIEIRYLWSATRGLSRANNEGIAAAHHDLLVFTHDDVFVSRTWYGELVRALIAAGEAAVVTGQVRPTSAEQPGGFQLTVKTDPQPAVYRGRLERDVLYPLNMAMDRSAIQAVGGFDVRLGPGTSFPGAEDNDMGLRLLMAGFAVIYAPQAVIFHRAWRSAADYVPMRWGYGLARGAFYAKYFLDHDHIGATRMRNDVITHLVSAVRAARHTRQKAAGDLALAAGILVGAFQWFARTLAWRTHGLPAQTGRRVANVADSTSRKVRTQ